MKFALLTPSSRKVKIRCLIVFTMYTIYIKLWSELEFIIRRLLLGCLYQLVEIVLSSSLINLTSSDSIYPSTSISILLLNLWWNELNVVKNVVYSIERNSQNRVCYVAQRLKDERESMKVIIILEINTYFHILTWETFTTVPS